MAVVEEGVTVSFRFLHCMMEKSVGPSTGYGPHANFHFYSGS